MICNNFQPKSLYFRKCDSCLRTFKTARGLKLHAKKSGQFSQCYRNNDVTVKASKIKSAEVRKNEAKTVKPSKVSLADWDGGFAKGTTLCEKVKKVCLNVLQVSLQTSVMSVMQVRKFKNFFAIQILREKT